MYPEKAGVGGSTPSLTNSEEGKTIKRTIAARNDAHGSG
jgi:hypothetical protein